jgi:hypothetical protein
MSVRAVPVTYNGIRFRSTLEADWACTMDHYRIAWQYEPEAFQLPSGVFYRPDFWLPEITTWLEVKGPHRERVEKAEELRWAVQTPPEWGDAPAASGPYVRKPWRMVVVGGPPDSYNRLNAMMPGASTMLTCCGVCRRWQWNACFEGECRWCNACGDGDLLYRPTHREVTTNRLDRLAASFGFRVYETDFIEGFECHRVPRLHRRGQ